MRLLPFLHDGGTRKSALDMCVGTVVLLADARVLTYRFDCECVLTAKNEHRLSVMERSVASFDKYLPEL